MAWVKPTRLRWFSQVIFFLLFLFLLLRTEFRGSLLAHAGDIRLPYPVNLFFRLDPLVALSGRAPPRTTQTERCSKYSILEFLFPDHHGNG